MCSDQRKAHNLISTCQSNPTQQHKLRGPSEVDLAPIHVTSGGVSRCCCTDSQQYSCPTTGGPLLAWPVQVLSDFIVENRGIVPHSIKSAADNIEQVNLIVRSTYAACTQPDPEGAVLFLLKALFKFHAAMCACKHHDIRLAGPVVCLQCIFFSF